MASNINHDSRDEALERVASVLGDRISDGPAFRDVCVYWLRVRLLSFAALRSQVVF